MDVALRHGWEPDARGGTHYLTEAEHGRDLTLTDFVLTDGLRPVTDQAGRRTH